MTEPNRSAVSWHAAWNDRGCRLSIEDAARPGFVTEGAVLDASEHRVGGAWS